MKDWKPTQYHIDWTRKMFESMNDQAVWGIPDNRSIYRIDKSAKTLTCIHGERDYMFDQLTIVCQRLGYTTAYKQENLPDTEVAKHLPPVELGADVYGAGKSIVTDHVTPEKKFLWREITDADRAAYLVNLAQLPETMRWKGRATPQCDFCSNTSPIVTYAANKLTTGEVKDCWRWLACKECHAAITRNDFDALEQRAYKCLSGAVSDRHLKKTVMFSIKLALLKFHKEAVVQ